MQTRIQKKTEDANLSNRSARSVQDNPASIQDNRAQTTQLKALQAMMSNCAQLQKNQPDANVGDKVTSAQIEISSNTEAPAKNNVLQGYWDVACKPGMKGDAWCISKIVIKNRPPNPDTGGMTQHGGNSFHHESAWNFIERQVLQFEGLSINTALDYLMRYGLTGSQWPPMAAPGDDQQFTKLAAINDYFHAFLLAKAAEASGWLGPKGTHSSQGGKISAALKSLKSMGFTYTNIDKALAVSFEPAPDLNEQGLTLAAEEHADMFYAAFQLFLEENDDISIQSHEEIIEAIKDWTTRYWNEPMDF